MKIFKKFKQLSRDIKLIIITALIASCVGVYAAGECIISATADDVTYNNTSVQAAIDELYSMSQDHCPEGYECRQLKYVTDCSNNKVYTTTPNNLSGLAKIMAEEAYLDNGKSEYVSSCNGVSFNNTSSNSNGKGIYEIASTKNDTYPIYYYRGAVDNNNVKFAGFCWKAIRTTDTGGVKMIYNGEPDQDGYCINTTGTNTQIGTSYYNSINNTPVNLGYVYGSYTGSLYKSSSSLTTAYNYGNGVTYSGGTYTLTNTMTSTGTWSSDYNTLNNNHYTCFSTGNTCSTVNYIFYTNSAYAFYLPLRNGNKIEDALADILSVMTTDSTSKAAIDTWYNTNLSSYSSYIEDTVFCNDRSVSALNGWDPNGGVITKYIIFSPNLRTNTNYTPSLTCSRNLDKFTVSSSIGNGALTYPVGLITVDEVMYAGGKYNTSNNAYYLHTGQEYWTLSPSSSGKDGGFIIYVSNSGLISYREAFYNLGLRPVVSLTPTSAVVSSGDGTSSNPYVI